MEKGCAMHMSMTFCSLLLQHSSLSRRQSQHQMSPMAVATAMQPDELQLRRMTDPMAIRDFDACSILKPIKQLQSNVFGGKGRDGREAGIDGRGRCKRGGGGAER